MQIPGPAGGLEARHDLPPAGAFAQAVLCHPHPRYGGSMHDAVLDTLAQALLRAGAGVLRFNFRGVGASAGGYADGTGETEDLLAAVQWLRETTADSVVWVGGYSFGAWVAWNALEHDLAPERLVLIAPPVGTMTFPRRNPGCPVHVVVGAEDDFVDFRALEAWSGIDRRIIAGADHFFGGCMGLLAETLEAVLRPGDG